MNKIDEFLVMFDESTQKSYGSHLKKFFETITADPETYFEKKDKKRDYEEDVKQFWLSIKNRPPKTIRAKLYAVKSFLREYDVELSNKFWKNLNRRR